MTPIKISRLDRRLVVRFSGKAIVLPGPIQAAIDAYWESLMTSGKTYHRGEVFTVTDVTDDAECIDVLVEKTDYAHYLYCQDVDTLEEHGVRIIHTAGPIITGDRYVIFGEMGSQTAQAGKYQLCGGGLDNNDLTPDGCLDTIHNIKREFLEEFGVDSDDQERVKSFSQKYLKTGGPTGKMTIISVVELFEMKDEFLEKYQQFEKGLRAKGELPEFARVVAFSLDDTLALREFIQDPKVIMDEYNRPFLEFLLEESKRG